MRRRPSLTLHQYYLATWAVALLIAFLLTALSRVLPLDLVILISVVCLWIVAPEDFRNRRLPKPGVFAVTLLFLVFSVRGSLAMVQDRRPIQLLVCVVAGLIPVFLRRGEKAFGFWIALFSVALVAIISVIARGQLLDYALFILFLGVLLLNINAANLVQIAGKNASRYLRLPDRHFRQFLPSMGWGLVLATLIFLFFPRKPAINNPFGIRENGEQSGYTGSLSLKSRSQITPSSELAMIVESSDVAWLEREGPNLLFRGNTLDTFDGTTWSLSDPGTREYRPGVDLRFTVEYLSQPKQIKIFRQPHSTRGIIYPHVPLDIKANTQLLSGLYYDSNGNLTRGHSENIRYAYEMIVAEPESPHWLDRLPIEKVVRELRSPRLSHPLPVMPGPEDLDSYLSIPFPLDADNFFSRWVQEVGMDTKRTGVLTAVETLRDHFKRKFSPMIQFSLSSQNGFESFLSRDRKGHCEYFATAATLYFRALGIPTRLGLGYRGGKYNPVSKVLEVSEHHAHAWTELYFPNVGWISLDVTPQVMELPPTKLEALLTIYLGAAKFWANHYLVDYDDMAQRRLVKTLATSQTYGFRKWTAPDFVDPNYGVLGALFVGLSFFLVKSIRRRRAKGTLRTLPDYYLEFLKKLERAGYRREPGETFRQFHARLPRTWLLDLNRRLVSALERDLYSSKPLEERDRRELRDLVTKSSWSTNPPTI